MLSKSAQVQVPYRFDFASRNNIECCSIVADKSQCFDVNWIVRLEFDENEVNSCKLIFAFDCVCEWDIIMNLMTSADINLCADKKIGLTSPSHIEVVTLPETAMKSIIENNFLDILLTISMVESGCTPLQWWNELSRCITLKAMPDMCILVGDKSIPVHKSMLNAKSNVFATMLNSDMSESMTNQLHVTDFSYDVVLSFLRCIYDEHCVDTELTHYVEQLLVIANKYEVVSLFQKAEKYLISTLTVDNVISLLCLADLHNSQLLKSEAMQVLTDNSAHVLQNVRLSEILSPVLCNEFILYTTGSDGSMCVNRKRKWKEISDATMCPNDCKLVVSINFDATGEDSGEDDENGNYDEDDDYVDTISNAPCGEYYYIGNNNRNNAMFEKRGVYEDSATSFVIYKGISYGKGGLVLHRWYLTAQSPKDPYLSEICFDAKTTESTKMPIGICGDYIVKCYHRK